MSQTQLLCTFGNIDELDSMVDSIVAAYKIAFDSLYVLRNVDSPCAICCTYNIFVDELNGPIAPGTISLHRRKSTNTLYTINALNLLVSQLNNGHFDRNFMLPWEDYKNTILVTAYGELKIIKTKLDKLIKVSEI